MSTTSLKLPEDVKQLAVNAAQELGISTHAFMVEAIRQAAHAAQQRSQFVAQAVAARADMQKNGTGYAADDVRAYLRNRLSEPGAARPEMKPWRK